MRSALLACAFAALTGCGDDDSADGTTGPTGGAGGTGGSGGTSGLDCPEGFTPRTEGPGCVPIIAEGPCEPGTMPAIGVDTCQPVGNTMCPAGFEPDQTGFGCIDIIPTAPCSGATRSVLGQRSCQPVGDCGAAFPPAAATLFVDDDFGPGQLDATHFATIQDAVNAAANGATIAIDAGNYVESIDIDKPLTLIGRCPAQVTIGDDGSDLPGIQALNVTGNVTVRGMTVTGHVLGIAVQNGPMTADQMVIDGTQSAGAIAAGSNGVLTLQQSVVRNTIPNDAGNPPWGVGAQQGGTVLVEDSDLSENDFANAVAVRVSTKVEIRRSVVRDGRPPLTGSSAGTFGLGVYAFEGGQVYVEESAIVDNQSVGANSSALSAGSEIPANLELVRTVVRGTKTLASQDNGRGVSIGNGATARIQDSWILDNERGDVVVVDGGLEILGSVLTGVTATEQALFPNFIAVGDTAVTATNTAFLRGREAIVATQLGAQVTLDGCLLAWGQMGEVGPTPGGGGALGFGLSVASGSKVSLINSTVLDNQAASILSQAEGSTVTLDGSLVRSAMPIADGRFGRGIEITQGATMSMTRSAVLDHHEIGLLSGLGGSVTVENSTIGVIAEGTDGIGSDVFAHAVMSLDGGALTVSGSTIFDAVGIGVGVAAASALIVDSVITSCGVGVHVQDGVELVEADAPSAENALTLSPTTQVVDNIVRIGSGTVALPTPIGATQ